MAFDFLDKKNIIAKTGFNRWLIPPAALAIHLCIGMAYGFSVFWLPLSKAIGINKPIDCGHEIGLFQELFTTTCDWKISTLGWMYTMFFVFLGISAAVGGGWIEKAGPRKVGFVASCCWCGGMLFSALGVYLHQFWMMLLGSGVIGGVGLGLGYISPVSVLIRWFPDRRGMATGMAIMGFGGGAMIGSPLAVELMNFFASDINVGVYQTFVVMAIIHFIFMMAGALSYRIPAANWQLKNRAHSVKRKTTSMLTQHHVQIKNIWKTPQFWLVWMVLCMNVSAGIGVIGMASPMLQEVFAGSLIGNTLKFSELNKKQLSNIASIAAGFTALLSLFNIGGRFFWASISDFLGRKTTYCILFILGGLLYFSIPTSIKADKVFFFIGAFCIILSMYGGGFATLPAYLADLFGAKFVGAVHGKLLTAWSTAGVIGPVVVNYMRDYQLSIGIPKTEVYNQTMYILMGMLVIGFICNLLIKPVANKWLIKDDELNEENDLQHKQTIQNKNTNNPQKKTKNFPTIVILAWSAVSIPLAWGMYQTILSVTKLF